MDGSEWKTKNITKINQQVEIHGWQVILCFPSKAFQKALLNRLLPTSWGLTFFLMINVKLTNFSVSLERSEAE